MYFKISENSSITTTTDTVLFISTVQFVICSFHLTMCHVMTRVVCPSEFSPELAAGHVTGHVSQTWHPQGPGDCNPGDKQSIGPCENLSSLVGWFYRAGSSVYCMPQCSSKPLKTLIKSFPSFTVNVENHCYWNMFLSYSVESWEFYFFYVQYRSLWGLNCLKIILLTKYNSLIH